MAWIVADNEGQVLSIQMSDDERAQFASSLDNPGEHIPWAIAPLHEFEFDEEANREIIDAIHNNWNKCRIKGRKMKMGNKTLELAPPAHPIEQILNANPIEKVRVRLESKQRGVDVQIVIDDMKAEYDELMG